MKTKVKEILRAAYLKHGNSVFRDPRRLTAYLDDWLYEYPIEKKRISLAINDGIIEKLFAIEKEITVDKINTLKAEFIDTYKIQPELAKDVIDILMYAIFYFDDLGDLSASRSYNKSTTIPIEKLSFQIKGHTLLSFSGLDSNIKIPDNVTSVADKAFINNDAIKSVVFSANIQDIQCSAFRECVMLSSVGLNGKLKLIGKNSFYGCKSIKKIEIPDSVTEIQDNAFMKSGLVEIRGMANVQTFGSGVFQQCMNLKKIELFCPILDISDMMFYDCNNLECIILPKTVKSIGNMAFSGCENLTAIKVPSGLQSIGIWAFQSCKSLKEIYIPKSVTKINEYAFEGCSDLCIYSEHDSMAVNFAIRKGFRYKII